MKLAWFLLLFLISFEVSAAPPAKFSALSKTLFRSDQTSDLTFYQRQGIRTIIDLRTVGDETILERREAEMLGLRYISIPLSLDSNARDYLAAERKFFATIDDVANGPTVFHCRHGKDRTGLMAALYRIERDGWTADEAIAEWKSFGGFADDWGTTIRRYFSARAMSVRPRICSAVFTQK